MAYIEIQQGERPMGWRELKQTLTVGRQRECDICTVDTRLSRMHCRFEREGQDWAVVDLGSKNGTWCDGISIDRVLLMEGDRVQVGRLIFTFHVGDPPKMGQYTPRPARRPADPREALAETIAGVTVVERPRDPWLAQGRRAQPRPMPRELTLEETGCFAAVLDAPVELDVEKPLRSYRPPRVRPLPKPLLMDIPGSPALDDRPRKRAASPVESPQPQVSSTVGIPWKRVGYWAGQAASILSVLAAGSWAAWQWSQVFR